MRRILLIAKRDFVATVKTKAFLVGLIVAPILFGGGFLAMALLKDKPETKPRHVAVLDRTGLAAATVIRMAREKSLKVKPGYVLEEVKPVGDEKAQRLALSDRVRRGELYAFLEIGPEALHPGKDKKASSVGYYSNAGAFDETQYWFANPVNEGLRSVRLAQLGVDESRFKDLVGSVPVEKQSLVARDEKSGEIGAVNKRNEMESFGVSYGLVLLLGMIVMVGSAPILQAVTQDKTQRVVEMLLGVATPFELMIGKVIAAVGVALTSAAFYVIGATLALNGLGMAGLIPFSVLPWFYVYLIADMAMLCALAAALGAACSTPQDAQSLAVLLLSPVLIPFFLILPVMKQPNGFMATALSLFPPFTPMVMLLRQTIPGGVPAWQPWVGLVGAIACAVATTWAAARIFRVAILMQGKAPKPAEFLRWAVRG